MKFGHIKLHSKPKLAIKKDYQSYKMICGEPCLYEPTHILRWVITKKNEIPILHQLWVATYMFRANPWPAKKVVWEAHGEWRPVEELTIDE